MAANVGNYMDALRRKLGASKGKGKFNLTHTKGEADPKAQAIAQALKSKMNPPSGPGSKATADPSISAGLRKGQSSTSIREALKNKITGTPVSGPKVSGTSGFGGPKGGSSIPPGVNPTKPTGPGGRVSGPYLPSGNAPRGGAVSTAGQPRVPITQKPRRRKPGSGPYPGPR